MSRIKYSLEDLVKVCESEFAALNFTGNPQNLYDPLNYILSLGGKRIRPLLTLAANAAFDGDLQSAVPAAKAMEVFHNFSLIHDDLMDNADLRRGKETVHKKWNPDTAVLSGDLMLVKSVEIMLETPQPFREKCLKFFLKTAREVCEGQQLDMNFSSRTDVTEAEYLEMIRLKTAVLVGCALFCGAYTATGDEEKSVKMFDYGCAVGVAFQVWDDWLDVFGTPEQTGKIKAGDIREGKKTLVYLSALELLNENERAMFESRYSKVGKTEEDIDALLIQLRSMGVDEVMRTFCDKQFERAHDMLESIECNPHLLLQLTDGLKGRKS